MTKKRVTKNVPSTRPREFLTTNSLRDSVVKKLMVRTKMRGRMSREKQKNKEDFGLGLKIVGGVHEEERGRKGGAF